MLDINRRFKITTGVENDEMLSDFLTYFGVVIEWERYIAPYLDGDATRMMLECSIEESRFDELVEKLRELFKDVWAVIAY